MNRMELMTEDTRIDLLEIDENGNQFCVELHAWDTKTADEATDYIKLTTGRMRRSRTRSHGWKCCRL